MALATLKARREFLAVRGGARVATKAFVLEARARGTVRKSASEAGQGAASLPASRHARAHDASPAPPPVCHARFGFTVTKKLGNAVVRNRIKRRLREAIRANLDKADPTCDYVVVARASAHDIPFGELDALCASALKRLQRELKREIHSPRTKV
ncbi:MAG: ribonuclease P protein component [Hyphomicrobiaceae bacterium]